MIIASDGVWDVFTNKKLARLVNGMKDPCKAATKIATHSRRARLAHAQVRPVVDLCVMDFMDEGLILIS